MDLGETALWTRVNALEPPWVLDDLTQLVSEIGDKLEVIMIPKVEGAWDIHYVDRLLAQLEAKAGLEQADPGARDPRDRPGVANLEEIAARLTAHPGDELRPGRPGGVAAHEDHPRGRRASRLPHDRRPRPRTTPRRPRASYQQDPWHYSIARMVDACTAVGALPFYGPYGDIKDTRAARPSSARPSCSAAWAPGRCIPGQIEIAKRVFSPDPEEVAFARKVIEAIPDGRGVHMIDGKMQDDATWKQCQGDGQPR